jgi:hypothetical protein
MIGSRRLVWSERKPSDMALDGLFAGLIGGVAMAAYLLLWGLAAGRAPGALLGMFDPGAHGQALAGALTHLAIAAVYGIVFGLLRWLSRRAAGTVPAWLIGAAYGLSLLIVAQRLVLPARGSPLAEIPALHFAIAHLVYGAVLGWLSERLASGAA